MKINKELLILFIALTTFLGVVVYRALVEYGPVSDLITFLIATVSLVAIIVKLHFHPKE